MATQCDCPCGCGKKPGSAWLYGCPGIRFRACRPCHESHRELMAKKKKPRLEMRGEDMLGRYGMKTETKPAVMTTAPADVWDEWAETVKVKKGRVTA